ncbi:MAG: putative toxin-antitoxin system toxin component, PIN family [Actinobacteria bacterium]|nr:putative toxin-antitoxin system toxin component, PIN family [Actinomycetota bacterium]
MRVVLDTNVLVSAFVFPGGPPEAVYRRMLSGEVTMIVSRPLLAELGRVLIDKFDWEPAYAEEVVAQLLRIGELVEPGDVVEDIEDDPADNRVLEAAAEGEADVIVSGDRHLLALGQWRDIPIVNPAGFVEEA